MANDGNHEEIGRQNPSPGVRIHLGQSNLVLLTVTSKSRKPWLLHGQVGPLLAQTWRESTAWLVGEYLLMPDHLHMFCAPKDLQFTIEDWIKYWKREFAIKHGCKEWKFQTRGWHHRLRNGESFTQKWLYVQENPVRKGLITDIHQWPRTKARSSTSPGAIKTEGIKKLVGRVYSRALIRAKRVTQFLVSEVATVWK